MPQLDFSFYLSQITWLLICFGVFFCICNFVILPRLERIFQNRSQIISSNIDFSKNILEKAKKLNSDYDLKISEINKQISGSIAIAKKENEEKFTTKINKTKSVLLEEENNNIVKIKKEINDIESEIRDNISNIVYTILQKAYCDDKITIDDVKKKIVKSVL